MKRKEKTCSPQSCLTLTRSLRQQCEANYSGILELPTTTKAHLAKQGDLCDCHIQFSESIFLRSETDLRESPKTSPLDLKEDFDLPHSVLSNMQGLIEEGQLSREDVIEHLINNGFLPVEVTELGRIPITVGVPDNGGDQHHSLSK